MSAGARARPGMLRTAAGAVVDFLVEPEAAPVQIAPEAPPAPVSHPVVAVIGLAPRCGATVVARGLATELARRTPSGVAAVTAADAGGIGLGVPAATRLARAVTAGGGGLARAAGRLCLVEAGDPRSAAIAARSIAPLVFDVDDPTLSTATAALADAVVVVASPSAEPALAAALTASLRRAGPEPVVVLARVRGGLDRWEGRYSVRVPESRIAAQAALAGRQPRGEAGRALCDLADRLEAAR